MACTHLRTSFKPQEDIQICMHSPFICFQEAVDASIVKSAWECLLPSLLEEYDSDKSLPCVCPRPLFIVNGADDPRCPVAGLLEPLKRCRQAYRLMEKSENFGVHIEAGAGHEVTELMDCLVEEFFVKALKPAGWQDTLDAFRCCTSGGVNRGTGTKCCGASRRGGLTQRLRSMWGRASGGQQKCEHRSGSCIPLQACCESEWASQQDGAGNSGRADTLVMASRMLKRQPSHHAYQDASNMFIVPV
jgi:hypothetical protein